MSAVYAPGKVGMIFTRGDDALVVRRPDGDWLAVLSGERLNPYLQPHPLVVIDPEDRAQVERLRSLNHLELGRHPGDTLQDALRVFANPTPPKPEEPSGLGALVEVEDEFGGIYVRQCTGSTEQDMSHPWLLLATRYVPMSTERLEKGWREFDAVRVLWEGASS